jgi:tungstate transport system substrate-binding protein
MIPAFEQAHPEYDVVVVAVGSGEALELGRRRDADVLLVHSPVAESVFVAQQYGMERRAVMVNDFIIVGPGDDAGGVRAAGDAAAALRAIARNGAPFVSRGDDSGTHRKERALWKAADTVPAGKWYLEAGQGMGDVLAIASERLASTLTDRGTYLALRDRLDLQILLEGDPALLNPYGVIPVAGAANPEGAMAFTEWITSPAGQDLIAGFGVDRFGQPLFRPAAAFGEIR